MRIVKTAALAFALVLLLSVAAPAAELFGGPLAPSVVNATILRCHIVNIHDHDIFVTLEIFDDDGDRVVGPNTIHLTPRDTTFLGAPADIAPRTCRFSGDFNPKKVRATVQVFGLGTIAAVEAR